MIANQNALGLIRGGNRFSHKVMRKQEPAR